LLKKSNGAKQHDQFMGQRMLIASFVSELFSSGQIRVPNPESEITVSDRQAALEIVRERSLRVALDYPGPAPAVNWPACEWALVQFYRACKALVYRGIDEETLHAGLQQPCPEAPLDSKHYSVDLIFIFLPELAKLARASSPTDPLVMILERWGSEWPLSSVGMKLTQPVEHIELRSDPRLWQYYLERITQRGDRSRESSTEVREGLASLRGTQANTSLELDLKESMQQ